MTPRIPNCNTRRLGRAALGLLRPLRGSGFALGQPDHFATGESRAVAWWGEASRRAVCLNKTEEAVAKHLFAFAAWR